MTLFSYLFFSYSFCDAPNGVGVAVLLRQLLVGGINGQLPLFGLQDLNFATMADEMVCIAY